MGIELEVCYLIKKTFFNLNQKVTKNNMKKFITHIAPCIEVVGYRQKKKGIKSLGDLCSDFGANVKFVLGSKKKFRNQNVKNLKTHIFNKKIKQSVDDIFTTDDAKYDADVAVDNMFEELGVDRDMFDQKEVLDAYGLAYD